MFEQECFITSLFLLCVFNGFLLHPLVAGVIIPLGSKLSVIDNDRWVSSNGDFALEFLNISDDTELYNVGIRFNSESIPYSQQKVVWVAGDYSQVGNKSYFQLTLEGDLVLFDPLQGGVRWNSGTVNKSVFSAALHDNGNLVLKDRNQNIIWKSFDHQTDTLLPGQTFYPYRELSTRKSPMSLSSPYSLNMNASGHLLLQWFSNITYWRSKNPSASSNLTASLNTSGAFQILDRSSKPVWSVFGEDYNNSVKYRFLKLDVDGNLRLYSWIEASQLWRSVWQAVENQCEVFAICGRGGICVLTASGSVDCLCPFERTENGKCLIPFEQRCKSGYTMRQYNNMHVYGIYTTGVSVIMSNLQQCKQLCLNDTRCMVATFSGNGSLQCSIIKTKYVTGNKDSSIRSVSFVKQCLDTNDVNTGHKKSPPAKLPPKLLVPVLIGVAVIFFIAAILQAGILFYICKRKNFASRKEILALAGIRLEGFKVLSFSQIKILTEDFKNEIRSNMFEGMLPDNMFIMVKDLNASIEERMFRRAAMIMGNIHHKNIVKLVGYCYEFNHRFLVYEYSKNGTLDMYIHDSTLCKKLTWRKRIEICVMVAKAISHMHSGCLEIVTHGNLKSENVILDENFEAKVTEFGFTIINGEAIYCGASTEKDERDFGMFVLTLLTGCRDEEDLCKWTYKEWIEGRASNVVDKRIDGTSVDLEELERTLRIAFWCLQTDELRRCSMYDALTALEFHNAVDPPPPPFA